MAVTEKHVLEIEDCCTVTVEVDTDKAHWEEDRIYVRFSGFDREPLVLTGKEVAQVNTFTKRHTEDK